MAIELGELDSMEVKDTSSKKSLMGVAIMAGEITLTAGDISVSDVVIKSGTVNVEPGTAPLHVIQDSGVATVEPGTNPLHAIVDSGVISLASRDIDTPLGTVKVQSGSVAVQPGSSPIHTIVDSGDIEVSGSVSVQPGAAPIHTIVDSGHAIVDSGHIIVDSVTAQVNAKLNSQASSSGDGVLTTDYAQDYMVRGKAFQIQRRISLTANQTLYWVVDFSTLTGKIAFALPAVCRSGGGLVFLDTFSAASYTGGSTETPNKLNENSVTNPVAVVKSGITPTGQSNLREYIVGTAKTNQASGGGPGGADVPKIIANAPRVFKFVNQESSAVTIDFGFVWYELDAA